MLTKQSITCFLGPSPATQDQRSDSLELDVLLDEAVVYSTGKVLQESDTIASNQWSRVSNPSGRAHSADQPDVIGNFPHIDVVTREDDAEVDLASAKAESTVLHNRDRLMVQRIDITNRFGGIFGIVTARRGLPRLQTPLTFLTFNDIVGSPAAISPRT